MTITDVHFVVNHTHVLGWWGNDNGNLVGSGYAMGMMPSKYLDKQNDVMVKYPDDFVWPFPRGHKILTQYLGKGTYVSYATTDWLKAHPMPAVDEELQKTVDQLLNSV